MNATRLIAAALLIVPMVVSGQAKMRKMASNLNHPAINNYAPYISMDGNSMVYLADLGEDHALTMAYTTRQGINWKDPAVLPRNVNHRLNFLKGYALSPDGKTLYLSNMKSNGMGGFDLYTSQLKGAYWEEPENMLLPANSKGHEACPSISLDGNLFFYMRCETMDVNRASGCRILMMKKKANGQWDNPIELPDFINTGNSQAPRIMGDGELLIFSSDRLQPNRGGMDLYFTRYLHGEWSKPLPLDFANTIGDDQYVSATSTGMYLLKESAGQRSSELVEFLFPPDVRPKGTLRIEGVVAGPADLTSPYVTVYDLKDQGKVSSARPNNEGAFVVYMNYGSSYELAVEPADDHFTFFSKLIDLRAETNPMIERLQVNLGPLAPGIELPLEGLQFEPASAILTKSSSLELSRLARLIKGNPEKSFGVEVTLFGFQQDSLRSSADLTEVAYDSSVVKVTYTVTIPRAPRDSTAYPLDSIGTPKDSAAYRPDSVVTKTRDSVVVRKRYHNDRTLKQAKSIESALIRAGVAPGKLASSGKAVVEAIPERRRTYIQVIVH